jgi:ABC-type transport system substrate-binding protein
MCWSSVGSTLAPKTNRTGRYTEHGGTTGQLDPSVPWTKKEVRQAMNKAINRAELRKVLYKDGADYTYVHGFYPTCRLGPHLGEALPGNVRLRPGGGQNACWPAAGYPKGFKIKAWLYPFAGAPELIP